MDTSSPPRSRSRSSCSAERRHSCARVVGRSISYNGYDITPLATADFRTKIEPGTRRARSALPNAVAARARALSGAAEATALATQQTVGDSITIADPAERPSRHPGTVEPRPDRHAELPADAGSSVAARSRLHRRRTRRAGGDHRRLHGDEPVAEWQSDRRADQDRRAGRAMCRTCESLACSDIAGPRCSDATRSRSSTACGSDAS